MKDAAAMLLAVTLTSCGGPSPTGSASAQASVSPIPSSSLACGDMTVEDCGPAALAALNLLPTGSGRPISVELGRGVVCPLPELLFEVTTCPAGLPPASGGEWIGNAVISLAGTSNQAYINLWKDGTAYGGSLIAIATPPAS